MYDCILNCVCFLKLQVWDRWGAGLLFYEVPVVCMTAFVLNRVCFHKPQVWDRCGAGLLSYGVLYACLHSYLTVFAFTNYRCGIAGVLASFLVRTGCMYDCIHT